MQPLPTRPAAPNPSESRRQDHAAKRKRLLQGNWQRDLEEELSLHLESARRAVWGVADMSSNIWKISIDALAKLYNENPTIEHVEDISILTARGGLFDRAELWPMMVTAQKLTLACNECLVRVDIAADGKNLDYRIVTPDNIYAIQPSGYNQPVFVMEYRVRNGPDKNPIWTVDLFDIRNSEEPKYQVFEVQSNGELGADLTEIYLGGTKSGAEYPFKNRQDKPYIPFSVYHSEIHGNLWQPFKNASILAGSLTSAAMMTMYLHMVKDCSWPQRYVAGLTLPMNAYDTETTARRNAIATDPASILCFTVDPAMEGMGQSMIGSFQAGGDVEKLLSSIVVYERRLAIAMGIKAEDVQRLSGDPRSGYSISVSQESTRQNQRKQAVSMRYGDLDLIQKSAMMSNRYLGTNLPEEGYGIEYKAVGLGADELKAQREDIIAKIDAGLIDPIDAILSLHPSWDVPTAVSYLERIEEGRRRFPFLGTPANQKPL